MSFAPKKTPEFFWGLFWSERRESNPRESAWEADAIPLGDSRKFASNINHYTISAPILQTILCTESKEFRANLPKNGNRERSGGRRCFFASALLRSKIISRAVSASNPSLSRRIFPFASRSPRRKTPRRCRARPCSNTGDRARGRQRACARRWGWGGRGK